MEGTTTMTEKEWTSATQRGGLLIAYFWADFEPSCRQMDQIFALLSTKHASHATFVKANPDDLPDIAEAMGVSVVPSFVFVLNGKKVDIIQGANPPELVSCLDKHLAAAAKSPAKSPETAPVVPPSGDGAASEERLRSLVSTAPLMLFMKGSPSEPISKFSREVVQILGEAKLEYGSFNVLQDPAVRQGLKDFSGWSTYPQLYASGKLVGGLDTVKALHAAGKLSGLGAITDTGDVSPSEEALKIRLRELVTSAKCMLFMKGSPDEPKCGFSARIVDILKGAGVCFHFFDILRDNDVRQGLKKLSDWPTYPQLYVDGALVGGLDIVEEMQSEGDNLAEELGVTPNWIQSLVASAPVMLFMKGKPDEPRCGFSKQIVALLHKQGVASFGHFDILSDQGVRQGLKVFSNWPTFPQLFVKGEFIGGLDVVRELAEEGELHDLLRDPPHEGEKE